MKIITLELLGLIVLVSTSCSIRHHGEKGTAAWTGTGRTRAMLDLVQYAKPICGTGTYPGFVGENNTFPGAVAPFGMIQWSPDTEAGLRMGGYYYGDKRISDFSVDHISGAGCNFGEDFAMMPFLGKVPSSPPTKRTTFAASFSHTNEVAKPGYYAVKLDNGLEARLTTTCRSGFGQFTYPPGQIASMMINAASDINGSLGSSIHINPSAREISGWSLGGRFCGLPDTRTIFFYAVFNHPFKAWSTWSGNTLTPGATNGNGIHSGAFVTFDMSQGQTVSAKVGISYVSVDNAQANVEAENPVSEFSAQDFNQAVVRVSNTWNAWLNRIQIHGGTLEERQTFYSMLYHALIGPTAVSDVNGQYMGYDGKVHTTQGDRVQYGIISGWDIYRSECQLLGMLAPKQAGDLAQSLLVDYQQGGTFPRWGVIDQDCGEMMGDPAAAMIPDIYAFGATNFDTQAAFAGLMRAATNPAVYAPRSRTYERDALADYLKLGYVPEHQKGGWGNVSMTLEYGSADFALSRFAKALGHEDDSALLLEHAQNWKNLFNPKTGYIQMKRRDGTWAPGFKNNVRAYDHDVAYVEGTAGQYVWMVPFNLKGLAAKMGGPEVAAKRLDAFFTKLNVGLLVPDAWMAWLGDEPCLETPWIYDFLGQPWKTQSTVRRAMRELYSSKPAAYPGNDDVGEMSSWYIFGALGMYPELPGSDVLVLGSPLFPKAVLHLQHGDVTIIGHGAAENAPYVQRLKVNGKTWNKPWIRFTDIAHGGTLDYHLGNAANQTWGSNFADAPPSFN